MTIVPGLAVRAESARILGYVLDDGKSLKPSIENRIRWILDPRDRALLEAICFQAIRHRRRYEYVLEQWLEKPLTRQTRPIHWLLISGLTQLDTLGVPAHAAVAATSEAVKSFALDDMLGLVNAILRRATREELPKPEDPAIASSHPDWLFEKLQSDWPERWPAILIENNSQAPMFVSANTRVVSREELMYQLRGKGIQSKEMEGNEVTLRLNTPQRADALPGWNDGAVFVQDFSSALAVQALAPKPNERMLDACAAPGGKTSLMAARLSEKGFLAAVDIDPMRIERVAETLYRLGFDPPNLEMHGADVLNADEWWDGKAFDAILLDAPCSATGIIRRQPDIKWHRRAEDITALTKTQSDLLDGVWKLLKPGGRMVYSTCSILKDENERQIDAFLKRTPDAVAKPLDAVYGQPSGAGYQRWPGQDGGDGFFYALLHKKA